MSIAQSLVAGVHPRGDDVAMSGTGLIVARSGETGSSIRTGQCASPTSHPRKLCSDATATVLCTSDDGLAAMSLS